MIYCIVFDGDQDYVEADGYAEAVALWKAAMQRENAPDEFDDEPESVMYLTDRPLIRQEVEQ